MHQIRFVLLSLLWIPVLHASSIEQPRPLNNNVMNIDDEVEMYSNYDPLAHLAMFGIPTTLGALSAYRTITGGHSSAKFARGLDTIYDAARNAQSLSGGLRTCVQNIRKYLTQDEITAIFANSLVFYTCGISTIVLLMGMLYHKIKAVRATDKFIQHKHEHNMNEVNKILGIPFLAAIASGASLALLIDYYNDGKRALQAGDLSFHRYIETDLCMI